MSRRPLVALGAFAAGIAVGAAAEEILYRRLLGGSDPEAGERLGSISGDGMWVETFDGKRLYASAFGPPDAPTCVLAHGLTLTHAVWHYQLRDLPREGLRVVAYDARGHGASDPVAGPLTPDILARDLCAVLNQTCTGPTVVVGHSMGGMTVQMLSDFAEDFEGGMWDRVRGVILVNTTFTAELGGWSPEARRLRRARAAVAKLVDGVAGDPRRLERLRLRFNDLSLLLTRVGFGAGASPSHVAFTRRLIESTPTETLAAAVRGLASFDSLEGLADVQAPVLVCAGEWDVLTPLRLAREIANRVPKGELHVFPRTGHMAMLERHEEFTRLVREFTDRVVA